MTSCLLIGKNHALIYNFLTKEQSENLKKRLEIVACMELMAGKTLFLGIFNSVYDSKNIKLIFF